MNSNVVRELKDYKYLFFSVSRHSSGTDGTFLKAVDEKNNKRYYYKLSNYNSADGFFGHESVNEIIVDRLLNILNINHLHYDLVYAQVSVNKQTYQAYMCVSENYKKNEESKISFESFYENKKYENEDILSFSKRHNLLDDIEDIILVDYLIDNRDRHGANIEVLYNKTKGSYRLAPIFDNGLSLLFSCTSEDMIKEYDVTKKIKAQSYFGNSDLEKNLLLIRPNKMKIINKLSNKDKEYIFKDLDGVISKNHQDKIWELINRRIESYGYIRNQRCL